MTKKLILMDGDKNKRGPGELIQVGNVDTLGHNSIWGRVYDPEGIAANITALGGGVGAKTGLYIVPVLTPDRPNKRQNGRRFKEPGDEMFTLTAQDRHGIYDGKRIRRLTPKECERLQGFADGWTVVGKDGKELSDNQRYKGCGNAVSVPVVEDILTKAF